MYIESSARTAIPCACDPRTGELTGRRRLALRAVASCRLGERHAPPLLASPNRDKFDGLTLAPYLHDGEPQRTRSERVRSRSALKSRREFGCANRMNAINVIWPYKHHGMWVFDDARVGLVQEPFVSGADTWIDRVVADIPKAENGFTLIFSSTPFPGHQYRLDWRRQESDGNWYYSADLDMEGWLCPALFRYFSDAPASLYAQVKAKA